MAKPLEEIERNWDRARKNAVRKLKGKVDEREIPMKWKRMSNEELRNHLVFCLLTSQTRVKILARYCDSSGIEELLCYRRMGS